MIGPHGNINIGKAYGKDLCEDHMARISGN